MKVRRVIISGGGTGGHLYPALTLGQKLKEVNSQTQLTFIGSSRSVEREIMARQGVDFIPLKVEGIKGKGLRIIKSLGLLPFSFLKSLSILIRKKPDLVIGVGGYSSGPVVLLASWMRIPTLIMEPNIIPGFTNRLLIPWVDKVVVAFKNSLSFFRGKGVFIGNPVREEFYNASPKPRNGTLAILVSGGSQGSHFLNRALVQTLPLLKREKEHLRIFHQTGKNDHDWVKKTYQETSFEEATVSPYFFDMASYFQKSDLIISRAGASTIAEIIAAQKASLLIPFAQSSDNHQVLNARELERVEGAEVLLESDFSPDRLAAKIFEFMENKDKISAMEKKVGSLKTEGIAEKIADLCFELMNRRTREGRLG